MRQAVAELVDAICGELAELSLYGPRVRHANIAALAVGLALVLALVLRLNNPWWAAISAFLCVQASHPQSWQKGGMRIMGTLVGAAVSFVLTPWLVYDPLATVLLLFAAGTLAILGALLSPHGYAWLLGGITAMMVTLGSLDDPTLALSIAFYRAVEIVLGTATALLMTRLLAPVEGGAVAPPPGWHSLLGRNWHVLSYAMRTGMAVAAVPLVWRQLELPNLSQMAISIGAVMAVPTLTGVSETDQSAIAQRMLQRIAGCILGGCFGAIVLFLPISQSFVPWLLLLMAGTWLAMQIQNGRYGIAGVGSQAAIALILTLVQDTGPADSLLPAINRIAGMMGAIGLLVLINLLLGPPLGAWQANEEK
ncbi:FUSC family protein [Rhizobium leucaenae]|uniref:Putative membrane protein YccC n=1 Tax=Rhizobium leucaenae TaxID=29450 RepID=A0A7W7EK82_9HYPH|nr:FUSC family protein [Rhizobium leucaenae]MBB4568127.1 putative membrane protein YccC [Rhizobium leucaenae]MBB6303286.1 putative membrane protein YccC [Rhizobium leucaenae]